MNAFIIYCKAAVRSQPRACEVFRVPGLPPGPVCGHRAAACWPVRSARSFVTCLLTHGHAPGLRTSYQVLLFTRVGPLIPQAAKFIGPVLEPRRGLQGCRGLIWVNEEVRACMVVRADKGHLGGG